MSTGWVDAPDVGDPESIVSAGQEPVADLTDPLQAEHAVLGSLSLVADVTELVQTPFEDRVELIAVSGDVASFGGSPGRTGGGFHTLQDTREVHRASPRRLGAT